MPSNDVGADNAKIISSKDYPKFLEENPLLEKSPFVNNNEEVKREDIPV